MYGFITTYGNGYKKIYIPKCDDSSNKQPYHALTREERLKENRRLRGVKAKGNFVQRASSTNSYNYFSTLTTDNEELANNPVELLQLGKKFLLDSIKKYNYTNDHFIVVLEKFENINRGFHLHALTDFRLNLDEWDNLHGANREKDSAVIWNEYGEIYKEFYYKKSNKNRNLYCEKLVKLEEAEKDKVDIDDEYRTFAVKFPINYMAKKIKETKLLIEEIYPNQKISLYASNVEKIDRNTEYVDIEEYFNDFENEKDEDFDNFISIFEAFENEKNENIIRDVDVIFYDFEKNYYDFNSKILKNETPIIFKEFLKKELLIDVSYVDYKTYKSEKINKIKEEITFFNFRIEEIESFLNEILRVNNAFDASCYLDSIDCFNKEIHQLQRRITILTNTNSPNSDNLYYSYNCNGFIEKESPQTPYHRDYSGVSYPLAHSLWLYGGANCPVYKNNVLKVEKIKKSHTEKGCFFDANFKIFGFLLHFLNYVRHIPGDN